MTELDKESRKYLIGYSDGLEVVAEQIKKLAHGEQSYDELLAVINGIIVALHNGQREVTEALSEEQEAFDELMVVVNNGEELLSLLKHAQEEK
jgi:hypothetical protein